MSGDDLTVKILIEIRDEIRGANARIDQTNSRIDQTNEGVAGLRGDLAAVRGELAAVREEARENLFEAETRLATRFVELISATRATNDMLVRQFELRDRVQRCEDEIAAIKQRLG